MEEGLLSKDEEQSKILFFEGLDFYDAEKFERAERKFLAAQKLTPGRLSVLNNLVSTLLKNERYSEAKRYGDMALEVGPGDAVATTNIATLALQTGSYRKGIEALENHDGLSSDRHMLALLGELRQSDCEYELAVRTFRAAITAGADGTEILPLIIDCLEELGQFEELVQISQELLVGNPDDENTIFALARYPDDKATSLCIEALAKYVDSVDIEQLHKDHRYHFAKAQLHHKAGNYRAAWDRAHTGNLIVANNHSGEIDSEYRFFNTRLDYMKNASISPCPDRDGVPMSLFIQGTSRSGKTTLEEIFCTATNSKRGYENKLIGNSIVATSQTWNISARNVGVDFPQSLDEKLRTNYIEELKSRVGAAEIFTCTTPQYITVSDRIAEAIPNARFVFIKRNIDDVCARIFMRLYESENYYAYDIDKLRSYIKWYNDYIDLLVHKMPDRCVVITYENMVADPATVVKNVAALCGVDCDITTVIECGNDVGFAEPYKDFM